MCPSSMLLWRHPVAGVRISSMTIEAELAMFSDAGATIAKAQSGTGEEQKADERAMQMSTHDSKSLTSAGRKGQRQW